MADDIIIGISEEQVPIPPELVPLLEDEEAEKKEFDESEHPREPKGTTVGGRFAKAPTIAPLEAEDASQLELFPRSRQDKLELAAREGVKAVEKLSDEMIEKGEEFTSPAQTWDMLSEDQQQTAQNAYEEAQLPDLIVQQEAEWWEGEKENLYQSYGEDDKVAKEYLTKTFPEIPEVVVDKAIEDGQYFGHGGQREIAQFVVGAAWDQKEYGSITKEQYETVVGKVKTLIEDAVIGGEGGRATFDEFVRLKVDEDIGNVEITERLREEWLQNASDQAGEDFFNLPEGDKLGWSDVTEADVTAREPEDWAVDAKDLGGQTSQETLVRALGRELVDRRGAQIAAERGLKGISKEQMDELGKGLWASWKSAATSDGGLALQYLAEMELGTWSRLSESDRMVARAWIKGYATDKLAALMNKPTNDPEAIGRAYVRGLWETSQFLFTKAQQKEVQLYRGIMMDGRDVDKEAFEPVPAPEKYDPDYISNFARLPNLRLEQGAASSWTSRINIANNWNGIGKGPPEPTRVVLRADVPTTAVLAVPIYGVNLHEESEYVVLGTPWKHWDAWRIRAPKVTDVAIKVARWNVPDKDGIREQDTAKKKGTIVRIDIDEEPHWLRKETPKGKTTEKWDEGKHPRHPKGSEQGGEFAPVSVGITSFRPEAPRTQAEVTAEVGNLAKVLQASGVTADVIPVEGGFGNEQEPSVRITAKGPDEKLLPALARAAQLWNQDAVLVSRPATASTPGAEPTYTWNLHTRLKGVGLQGIREAARDAGFGGWTIDPVRGTITVQTIPQWQDRVATRKAAASFHAKLKQAGWHPELTTRFSVPVILEKGDKYGGWAEKRDTAQARKGWRGVIDRGRGLLERYGTGGRGSGGSDGGIVEEEALKGGPGSGFHGHAGRPGQVGGSAPDTGGEQESRITGRELAALQQRTAGMTIEAGYGTSVVTAEEQAEVLKAAADAPDFIQDVLRDRGAAGFSIEVHGGVGPKFVVGGKIFTTGANTNYPSRTVKIFTESSGTPWLYENTLHELGHVGMATIANRAHTGGPLFDALTEYVSAVSTENPQTTQYQATYPRTFTPYVDHSGFLVPVWMHETFADMTKLRKTGVDKTKSPKSWSSFEKLLSVADTTLRKPAVEPERIAASADQRIDLPQDRGRLSRYVLRGHELIAHMILVPAVTQKGGPGSGFHGHAGRPGEVGGSAPSGRVPRSEAEIRAAAEQAVRIVPGADVMGLRPLRVSVTRLPLPIQDVLGRYMWGVVPGGSAQQLAAIEGVDEKYMPSTVAGATPNEQRTTLISRLSYDDPPTIAHELGHVIITTLSEQYPELIEAFDLASKDEGPLTDYVAGQNINLMERIGKANISVAANENFGEALSIVTGLALRDMRLPQGFSWDNPKHFVAVMGALRRKPRVWAAAAKLFQAALDYDPPPAPPPTFPPKFSRPFPRGQKADRRVIDVSYPDGRVSRYIINPDGTITHILIAPESTQKGGPGSGFHEHAGRPGRVGGSAPDPWGAENLIRSRAQDAVTMIPGADPAGMIPIRNAIRKLPVPLQDLLGRYAKIIPGGDLERLTELMKLRPADQPPKGMIPLGVTPTDARVIFISTAAYGDEGPGTIAHELGHVLTNTLGNVAPAEIEAFQAASEEEGPLSEYSARYPINQFATIGKAEISIAAEENFGEAMRTIADMATIYPGLMRTQALVLKNLREAHNHQKTYRAAAAILEKAFAHQPSEATIPAFPVKGVEIHPRRKAAGESIDLVYDDGRVSRYIISGGRYIAHMTMMPIAAQKAAELSDRPNSEVDLPGVTGNTRYRWQTVGDEKVCPLCEYLEGVGSFRLSDAMSQFDNFVSAAEDGILEDALVEAAPFMRLEEIDGLNTRELTALGLIVPPAHPRCRCGIIIV